MEQRWDFIVPLQLLVTSEAVWEERSIREASWLHSTGWLIRVLKQTKRRRHMVTHNTRIGPMGNDNFIGNIKRGQLSSANSKPESKMFIKLIISYNFVSLFTIRQDRLE